MVLTAYSQLYPFILQWIAGADLKLVQRALQDAAHHIFSTYDLWEDDLDPQVVVDYQNEYDLSAPSPDPSNIPSTYSAYIHRIKKVSVNSMAYLPPMYSMVFGKTLRFDSQAVPCSVSSCLLKCGVAGSVAIADWQALSNASLGVTLNGTSYSISSLDFAGMTFPQIALTIQTAIRQQAKSNLCFCRWYVNRFMLWTEAVLPSASNSSVFSALTAGTTGTDISGASWMNGLTAGTGVSNGGLLQVKAIIRPQQTCETLPNWLLDRVSDALVARSIWNLKMQAGPYYDPNGATIWETAYNIQISNLVGDKSRDYNTESDGFEA